MALIQVRILEPWNGYKANSVLTVTETTYYQTRSEGVKMHIVAESEPVGKRLDEQKFKSVEEMKSYVIDRYSMHDAPFIFDEEE